VAAPVPPRATERVEVETNVFAEDVYSRVFVPPKEETPVPPEETAKAVERVREEVTSRVPTIVEEDCDMNPPPIVSLPEVVSSALFSMYTSAISVALIQSVQFKSMASNVTAPPSADPLTTVIVELPASAIVAV